MKEELVGTEEESGVCGQKSDFDIVAYDALLDLDFTHLFLEFVGDLDVAWAEGFQVGS